MEHESLPLRVQRFYEDLARRKEPALELLGTVFAEDIRFKDPFRDTTGMKEFRVLFERMFRRYVFVDFTGFEAFGDDDAFTLTYLMHLRMAVGPTFVTPMASLCVGRDGRVVELADYYDFASGLVSPLRGASTAYRAVVNALFL